MNSTTLAEIAGILKPARRILAISHISPDGDAIGSLLGLGWLLRSRPVSAAGPGQPEKRSVTLVCSDRLPAQFRFLPGSETIVTAIPAQPWDAVITLDASDVLRLGPSFHIENFADTPVINLDHHVTNLFFARYNYVDARAAATAQIVVALADALGAPVGREAAVCLLTGLVTDTISFRTSNVTIDVMRTAVRLMEAGASLADITERAMNHRPLSSMRLWGLALSQLHTQGRIVWASITREMRAAAGAPEDGDAGLVGFLINAPEANVAAVFSETDEGSVEIGFRARPGYDVSELALSLGGGGHPQASGCTVPGPLSEAEARVVPMLQTAEANRLPVAG